MADKKATRVAYGEALAEFGVNPDIVVLDADLSKSTMTATFKKAWPDRFFNAGIAEANMMSVAAGLAAAGKIPFASTFAMFAAGRAYEPIRNSIGYPHLNVKIGASHAGITVGEDGATHQCIEDIALMRAIPGMTVVCPSDTAQTRLAVKAAIELYGPVYLRLSRYGVPMIYGADAGFELGRGIVLRDGADVAIIATGVMVHEALRAAESLAGEGIAAAVVDMHTIKPIDERLILDMAARCGAIVTAEEHTIIGGLGAAVAEVVTAARPVPVRRVGINDEFGKSGKADALMREYGLTDADIARAAREALAMKA